MHLEEESASAESFPVDYHCWVIRYKGSADDDDAENITNIHKGTKSAFDLRTRLGSILTSTHFHIYSITLRFSTPN